MEVINHGIRSVTGRREVTCKVCQATLYITVADILFKYGINLISVINYVKCCECGEEIIVKGMYE